MIYVDAKIDELQSLQYSLGAIKDATNNFSDDNNLGEGRFGIVYKVWQKQYKWYSNKIVNLSNNIFS